MKFHQKPFSAKLSCQTGPGSGKKGFQQNGDGDDDALKIVKKHLIIVKNSFKK